MRQVALFIWNCAGVGVQAELVIQLITLVGEGLASYKNMQLLLALRLQLLSVPVGLL